MKINKAELQKALEIVKPALATKEMIEQSTSFAFIENRVVTYNDETSISHPVPDMKLTGAVKAEKLYGFLSKSSTKEIGIQIKDGVIKLVSGSAKAGLAVQSEIRLPLDEEIGTKGKWKTLPDNFRDALKFTFPNCSSDMTSPILTCVNIPKDGRIEATNRSRLALYQIETLPIPGFLLPGSTARELVKYKVIEVARGKGWVHFRTKEDTIISCRSFEGKFIDTSELYKCDGVQVTFPKGIKEIIQRAQVFSKADHTEDEWIELAFSKDKLTIQCESGTDWFTESVKCDYKDADMTFRVVPSFLMHILDTSSTAIKSERVLKFEGENWTYLTALENIKSEE